MRIALFGCGYVGLVTGICFAERGHHVICCDIDAARIACLSAGDCPIYEPGLPALLSRNLQLRRLVFTTDAAAAVRRAAVVFITVGTPPAADGRPDLSQLWTLVEALAAQLPAAAILAIKSTVPAGTGAQVAQRVAQLRAPLPPAAPVEVVINPEFLREGSAVGDCLRPDRIIIGRDEGGPLAALTELYAPFMGPSRPILWMDMASAELAKYAANAMLATKISLMNEFSRLCEQLGANIDDIRRGIGADGRIGHQFLQAGLGYGGSCFPKDVRALIRLGEQLGEDLQILRAVEQTNIWQRQRFYAQLANHFAATLSGRRIALWGLAFKPGTDDLREAPSLFIIDRLLAAGASVVAFDPAATANARHLLGDRAGIQLVTDQYEALQGADALCVMTEWPQFRAPDFARMQRTMRDFVIFDGRNLYGAAAVDALTDCHYQSIGRAPSPRQADA